MMAQAVSFNGEYPVVLPRLPPSVVVPAPMVRVFGSFDMVREDQHVGASVSVSKAAWKPGGLRKPSVRNEPLLVLVLIRNVDLNDFY